MVIKTITLMTVDFLSKLFHLSLRGNQLEYTNVLFCRLYNYELHSIVIVAAFNPMSTLAKNIRIEAIF